MYEFLAWLETNRKKLIIGASVVVVVAVVFSFYRYQANQRELRANEALFKLGLPLGREESGARPNANAYLKVANDYVNTRAGERAMMMAAGALFGENNYAGAADLFAKFQSTYTSSPMVPLAQLGVATCLDAQDKTDAALKAYQEVVSKYSAEPVANQARLAIARIFEGKKQPEQALKLYDELGRADALGIWRAEVVQRREALMKLYPQLAPTNTPAPAPRQQVTITPVKSTNAAAQTLTLTPVVATNTVAPSASPGNTGAAAGAKKSP
jgi:predicted negative regulator of RcsB-dependent stress response